MGQKIYEWTKKVLYLENQQVVHKNFRDLVGSRYNLWAPKFLKLEKIFNGPNKPYEFKVILIKCVKIWEWPMSILIKTFNLISVNSEVKIQSYIMLQYDHGTCGN